MPIGFEGYVLWGPQVSRRVPAICLADPDPIDVPYHVGPTSIPNWDCSRIPAMVRGIGHPYDAGAPTGRRDYSLRFQFPVVDKGFLLYALQDPWTSPAPGNTSFGLPYFSLEIGYPWALEATIQFVDCLINSLDLEFSEGQPVMATVEAWAICGLPIPSLPMPAAPDGNALHWAHTDTAAGGADLRDRLSRVRVSIRNNLTRKGVRDILHRVLGGDEDQIWYGPELAISRSARMIRPLKGTVEVSVEARSNTALSGLNWDAAGLVVTATHPSFSYYPSPQSLRVTVGRNLMHQRNQRETPAGSVVTWGASLTTYASPAEPLIIIE